MWRRGWFVISAFAVVFLVTMVIVSALSDEDDGTPGLAWSADTSETAAPTAEATPAASGTEADDVQRCSVLDDETIELEVVNNSSETSIYWITTVYRDADGNRLGDELHIVSNLRPGERTIEEVFAFDVQGVSCDAADVDRYSAESESDELDDGVSCTLTGRDFVDDLTAEIIVLNDSSQTSDYIVEVAFVREDGVRVGTGTAFINAVAADETAPGDVFSTVDADASSCDIVSISRFES